MSEYICPYLCSFRTSAGYCGYTGGYESCQYRRINGFDYETKQFYAEPVKSAEEQYVWPPKTNADRIRAMSDEELAEFFSSTCCPSKFGGKGNCNVGCDDCWLGWLRQEVPPTMQEEMN